MLDAARKARAPDTLQTDPRQTECIDFYLPFGGKLTTKNRWAKLAGLVPWEQPFMESFHDKLRDEF